MNRGPLTLYHPPSPDPIPPMRLAHCKSLPAARRIRSFTRRKRSFPARRHSSASLAFRRAVEEVEGASILMLSDSTSPPSVMRNLTFLLVLCFAGRGFAAALPPASAACVDSWNESRRFWASSKLWALRGECFSLWQGHGQSRLFATRVLGT